MTGEELLCSHAVHQAGCSWEYQHCARRFFRLPARVTAFHDPAQKRLTVVFVNQGGSTREVLLSLEGFEKADGSQGCTLRLFRTAEKQSFKEVLTQEVDIAQPISAQVRERSLTSLVIENVKKAES